MADEPAYTSADALKDLGGKPDDTELERLKKYFPTYQFVHRTQLLQGMFDGSGIEELIIGKLTAKGLDTSITKQAKGGHGRWVTAKIRRTVIRLLYLRLRLDEDMTRIKANQQLVKLFKFSQKKQMASRAFAKPRNRQFSMALPICSIFPLSPSTFPL